MRAALLLALALAAGCAWGQARETVRIVTIFPKSGVLATGAAPNSIEPGVQFAVDEINDAGGLAGRKLELVQLDSKSTPLGARAAALEAIRLRPLAVIGERVSSLSLVIAPILQKAGVLMITPNSTHPDVTRAGDHIFRICYLSAAQGRGMAEFARARLHASSAAVLTNVSQKYSEELAQHFMTHFAALGGRLVHQGDYMQDASDFSAQLARVKAARPDVLFIPGYARDAGLLLRQAGQMGIDAIVLGGDAWGEAVTAYSGNRIDGSYRSAHWSAGDPSPASRQFVARFEQRTALPATEGRALSHDAVQLLADAVRRAGSLDRARVRDALAATSNLVLATGTINFDRERNVKRQVVVLRYDHGLPVYVTAIAP